MQDGGKLNIVASSWFSTSAITHQSVGLRLFIDEGSSVAPFCHLHGRRRVPFSGGTRDGGDSNGPGLG